MFLGSALLTKGGKKTNTRLDQDARSDAATGDTLLE
jgi:hypothetical protein